MRASLLLLAALAACSDASGPRHVPTLATQLSASVDTISGDALTVTLNASNPTDTTIHFSYVKSSVYAQVEVSGKWTDGLGPGDGFGGADSTDTLSLTSGANAPLGTIAVVFVPPATHLSLAPAMLFGTEEFSLSPGAYRMRACYFPSDSTGPGGGIVQGACANGVSITLVQ